MKKSQINIFLTAGVVTLLIFSGCVSGIVSTTQLTTTDASQQKNAVTTNDALITCYVGGIPHSQMISYESGTYLKELFSALASANAHDPCSAETQHLQQQILLYAEQQGLLPAGTSADTIFEQLGKRNQNFASQNIGGVLPVTNAGTAREMFCNFVSTGEGSAFPIIILPRFIPLVMSSDPPVVCRLENTNGYHELWWSEVRDWFYRVWRAAGSCAGVLGYWVQYLSATGDGVWHVWVCLVCEGICGRDGILAA